MRLASLVGVSLLSAVAACDGPRRADASADSTESPAPAADASAAVPAESSAEVDFVGVWAASPEFCGRNDTWRFTPERLATAGGVSCAIEGAARSAQGWSLQAVCTAEGPPAPAALTLATVGPPPASVMTVQGGPFATPVTLTRCTPPLSAAPE